MITAAEAKRLNDDAQRRADLIDLSDIEDMIIENAKKNYEFVKLRTTYCSEYVLNVLIENGFKIDKNNRTIMITW